MSVHGCEVQGGVQGKAGQSLRLDRNWRHGKRSAGAEVKFKFTVTDA